MRREPQPEADRYSEADRLEKRTQAHYRQVTKSDSSGKPTEKR
ncbi:MAG TPA: hypothetical protein VF134_03095 [Candidatus Dormibacteraeota bacterium]